MSSKLLHADTSGSITNVENATITTGGCALYSKNSTLNVTGGTITSTSGNSIHVEDGTLVVDGLTINTSGQGIFSDWSNSNVSNTKITSSDTSIRIDGGATLTNNNFTSNGSAIYQYAGSSNTKTIVNSGTYAGYYGYHQNSGNSQLKGGTFIGSNCGVFHNSDSITLGEDDDVININAPIIQGETYGIYKKYQDAAFNFYDGIIKGKTGIITGNPIETIASNTYIKYDTETDDDNNVYNTAYLVRESDFIENMTTHNKYKKLTTALDEASNNDELKLIDNGNIFYDVEIPNKNLTINLNNYKIDTVKQIINSGETTITDSSNEKGGKISTGSNIILIKNNNKLTLENINLSTNQYNKYLIDNTASSSELYTNNLTTNSYRTIDNSKKIVIINSNISGQLKNTTGDVSISGSTFNSTDLHTLYNYNGVMNITNSTISVNDKNKYGYYNNVDDQNIDKSTLNKVIISGRGRLKNDNGKVEVLNNSTLNTAFSNQGELIINNSSVPDVYSYGSYNSGILSINSSSMTSSYFFENRGLVVGTNSTYNCSNVNTATGCIGNSGDITFTGMTVNVTNSIAFTNTNTLTLDNTNVVVTNSNNRDAIGVQNSSQLYMNNSAIKMNNGDDVYGIKNTDGVVNILDSEIEVLNSRNAYGIYITGGEVTVGLDETPVNVSTTTPVITAVGTIKGIGVKKTSGQFNYYDGVITGSTEAIPEAPTDIPSRYRIVLQPVPNPDNYDVRILEYVP